jgi:hypothetical protein
MVRLAIGGDLAEQFFRGASRVIVAAQVPRPTLAAALERKEYLSVSTSTTEYADP